MALSPAEKQRQYRDRKAGLEAARALGRKYGLDEANRLLAAGSPRICDPNPRVQQANVDERVARAVRYAEWNWSENGRLA